MGLTSLQVRMDSSHWFHLQGTMQEDDESSSGGGGGEMEMLTCTRPNNNMMMERRMRPPQDQQALKCPRCESTHTKFCYYNNYSLSQPRYFCKTCRRYWTKGGTLRNIPVGGGCRKTSKKPNNNNNNKLLPPSSSSSDHNINQTDLQLSYLNNVNTNFMELPNKYNINPAGPVELMMEGIASSRNNNTNSDFMSNYFHFGMGQDHYSNNNNINVGGSYGQRVMLPYEDHQSNIALMDVKPRMLSLDWHDQNQGHVCTDSGKDSFGYPDVMGSNWGSGGMINGYGSSATNHHLM